MRHTGREERKEQRQKRPLILLHGFMQRGSSWRVVASYLRRSYEVFTPDLPGHGANLQTISHKNFSFDAHVEQVHAWVQSVEGILKPLLVGYSMGGRVALAYACKYPKTLSGLVLESAGLGLADGELRVARAARNEELIQQLYQGPLEDFVDAWDRLPLFASQKLLPQAVQEHQRELRLQNKPTQLAASLRYAGVQRMPYLRAKLLELDLPWLYLAGDLDVAYTEIARSLQEELRERAQDMQTGAAHLHRVEIVRQVGHNIHLEQPQEYCRSLEAFFKQIDFEQ